MPIMNTVVGTRRRKLTPADAIRSIEECQNRDEKLYTVRFRNVEFPGDPISFFYRGHGRSIYDVTLQDGEVCDLPLGCIMRIRETCNRNTDPQTRVKDSGYIQGAENVSVIDPRNFDLRADGTMDGKRSGSQGHLYILEFVSKELEELEALWTGEPVKKAHVAFGQEVLGAKKEPSPEPESAPNPMMEMESGLSKEVPKRRGQRKSV